MSDSIPELKALLRKVIAQKHGHTLRDDELRELLTYLLVQFPVAEKQE